MREMGVESEPFSDEELGRQSETGQTAGGTEPRTYRPERPTEIRAVPKVLTAQTNRGP
jgi:hypothetical protein